MNPTHTAIIAAICALLASLVTAWVGSRSAHEANEIAEYKASIEGMQETIAGMKVLQDAQGGRIEIAEYKASIEGMQETIAGMKVLQDAQGGRISALETELATVKTALVDEQRNHRDTRGLFRVATKHIRDLWAWVDGDRVSAPPPVPAQLTDWI